MPRVRDWENESSAVIRRPEWFHTPTRASTGNEGNRPDPNLPARTEAGNPPTYPRSAIFHLGPYSAGGTPAFLEESFFSYPGTARGRTADVSARRLPAGQPTRREVVDGVSPERKQARG